MRKITLNVVTKVTVTADDDMSMSDVMNGIDVQVSSLSDGFDVEDSEIEDFQVTDCR